MVSVEIVVDEDAALPTSSEKGYSKYILEFNNEFLIDERETVPLIELLRELKASPGQVIEILQKFRGECEPVLSHLPRPQGKNGHKYPAPLTVDFLLAFNKETESKELVMAEIDYLISITDVEHRRTDRTFDQNVEGEKSKPCRERWTAFCEKWDLDIGDERLVNPGGRSTDTISIVGSYPPLEIGPNGEFISTRIGDVTCYTTIVMDNMMGGLTGIRIDDAIRSLLPIDRISRAHPIKADAAYYTSRGGKDRTTEVIAFFKEEFYRAQRDRLTSASANINLFYSKWVSKAFKTELFDPIANDGDFQTISLDVPVAVEGMSWVDDKGVYRYIPSQTKSIQIWIVVSSRDGKPFINSNSFLTSHFCSGIISKGHWSAYYDMQLLTAVVALLRALNSDSADITGIATLLRQFPAGSYARPSPEFFNIAFSSLRADEITGTEKGFEDLPEWSQDFLVKSGHLDDWKKECGERENAGIKERSLLAYYCSVRSLAGWNTRVNWYYRNVPGWVLTREETRHLCAVESGKLAWESHLTRRVAELQCAGVIGSDSELEERVRNEHGEKVWATRDANGVGRLRAAGATGSDSELVKRVRREDGEKVWATRDANGVARLRAAGVIGSESELVQRVRVEHGEKVVSARDANGVARLRAAGVTGSDSELVKRVRVEQAQKSWDTRDAKGTGRLRAANSRRADPLSFFSTTIVQLVAPHLQRPESSDRILRDLLAGRLLLIGLELDNDHYTSYLRSSKDANLSYYLHLTPFRVIGTTFTTKISVGIGQLVPEHHLALFLGSIFSQNGARLSGESSFLSQEVRAGRKFEAEFWFHAWFDPSFIVFIRKDWTHAQQQAEVDQPWLWSTAVDAWIRD